LLNKTGDSYLAANFTSNLRDNKFYDHHLGEVVRQKGEESGNIGATILYTDKGAPTFDNTASSNMLLSN